MYDFVLNHLAFVAACLGIDYLFSVPTKHTPLYNYHYRQNELLNLDNFLENLLVGVASAIIFAMLYFIVYGVSSQFLPHNISHYTAMVTITGLAQFDIPTDSVPIVLYYLFYNGSFLYVMHQLMYNLDDDRYVMLALNAVFHNFLCSIAWYFAGPKALKQD